MSDIEVTRSNERRKAIAGALIQLGTALVAASSVKAYVELSFSIELVAWFLAAFLLIWSGWLLLGLLQREDD